ncbi:MAG: hypothetical protein AAF959_07690 [Cyanobacteria bacterium P01_D01_bin.56]
MTGISVLKDDIDSYGLHLQEDEWSCIKKIVSEFALVKKSVINRGLYVIHIGGDYDSHLRVPKV